MGTVIGILFFLVKLFSSLYLALIILRFLLQAARASFYNPVSQGIVKLTNPLLIPLRKLIPGLWGLDMAALILALLVHWLAMQALLWIGNGGPWVAPHLMVAWACVGVALTTLAIYLFAGIIIFISSFVAPYSQHPILMLTYQLMDPLMKPIRKFIPPVGGMDFSLFFVGIGLVVIRMLVEGLGQGLGVPFQYLIGYQGF